MEFLFQIGKVSKALTISKEMESCGVKHNNKTYSMLINGFIHLHDFANAFGIFEGMLKSGLQPDRAIYNLLIEAFCKMGNMDRAIRILEKMQKERMQASNRTFRPIIEGFAVAGDMKRALDTLDLMRRSGCAPTVMTFNALIHGLIRKHQVYFQLHVRFFTLRLTSGMSPFFLCVCSQVERAVSVLEKMSIAGIAPNEHTYTIIMRGYAAVGDIGKAFEYFTKIKENGLKLDVYIYETLLRACCKSGRMQSALAVTREMSFQKIPRNTFIYNILIDG